MTSNLEVLKMAEEEKQEEKVEAPKEEKKQSAKKPNLIYAALLLNSAGKEVNEENLKKIASSLQAEIEDAQVKALVAALDGVDIDEAISKAAMPTAVAAAPAAQAVEKKEEANEEEKEKKAEEAAEGLGALFG